MVSTGTVAFLMTLSATLPKGKMFFNPRAAIMTRLTPIVSMALRISCAGSSEQDVYLVHRTPGQMLLAKFLERLLGHRHFMCLKLAGVFWVRSRSPVMLEV